MQNYIIWGIGIFIAIALIAALLRSVFRARNLEESDENVIPEIPIDPNELLQMQIAKAISDSGIVRSTLRGLIASEIKVRVSESALDPNAFLPAEYWECSRSKNELLEDQEKITKLKADNGINRQREIGFIRQFLKENNISEEWLLQNGKRELELMKIFLPVLLTLLK